MHPATNKNTGIVTKLISHFDRFIYANIDHTVIPSTRGLTLPQRKLLIRSRGTRPTLLRHAQPIYAPGRARGGRVFEGGLDGLVGNTADFRPIEKVGAGLHSVEFARCAQQFNGNAAAWRSRGRQEARTDD